MHSHSHNRMINKVSAHRSITICRLAAWKYCHVQFGCICMHTPSSCAAVLAAVIRMCLFVFQDPICVTQLLSHLVFLTANGGMAKATALSDTFTTAAFIRVGVLADLPPEFLADMRARWGEEPPAGAVKVFDIFR